VSIEPPDDRIGVLRLVWCVILRCGRYTLVDPDDLEAVVHTGNEKFVGPCLIGMEPRTPNSTSALDCLEGLFGFSGVVQPDTGVVANSCQSKPSRRTHLPTVSRCGVCGLDVMVVTPASKLGDSSALIPNDVLERDWSHSLFTKVGKVVEWMFHLFNFKSSPPDT
jgi:hypothetical protein